MRNQVKRLDAIFSKWVRKSQADPHLGRVECITCGISKPWEEMDAGHFMPRAKMATRWDERNVQPQCRMCNRFQGGKPILFAMELDFRFGAETAQSLREKSNRLAVYSQEWIEDRIREYEEKYRSLG